MLTTIDSISLEQVRRSMLSDEFLKDLNKRWEENKVDTRLYQKRGGMFYYKNRILLSPDNPLTKTLISEHQDSPWGGHSGYERTLQRLQKIVYWKGLERSVRQYIKECDVCQRQKTENIHPDGLLQP